MGTPRKQSPQAIKKMRLAGMIPYLFIYLFTSIFYPVFSFTFFSRSSNLEFRIHVQKIAKAAHIVCSTLKMLVCLDKSMRCKKWYEHIKISFYLTHRLKFEGQSSFLCAHNYNLFACR